MFPAPTLSFSLLHRRPEIFDTKYVDLNIWNKTDEVEVCLVCICVWLTFPDASFIRLSSRRHAMWTPHHIYLTSSDPAISPKGAPHDETRKLMQPSATRIRGRWFDLMHIRLDWLDCQPGNEVHSAHSGRAKCGYMVGLGIYASWCSDQCMLCSALCNVLKQFAICLSHICSSEFEPIWERERLGQLYCVFFVNEFNVEFDLKTEQQKSSKASTAFFC